MAVRTEVRGVDARNLEPEPLGDAVQPGARVRHVLLVDPVVERELLLGAEQRPVRSSSDEALVAAGDRGGEGVEHTTRVDVEGRAAYPQRYRCHSCKNVTDYNNDDGLRCQRETAQTTSTEDASAASLPARCLLAL